MPSNSSNKEKCMKQILLALLSWSLVTAMPAKADTRVAAKTEMATFAGGCFWGTEEFFRKIPGVVSTRVGFTGGTTPNPKYDDTHDGHTGHAESVEIEFDPKKVSYETLLDQF